MHFSSVDFETYYDDQYSIKLMSPWDYVFHPRFDAYLVSIKDETEVWVGHPKYYDWTKLHDRVLVAHNAGFDGLVFKRLQQDGIIPASVTPKRWLCSADLSVYMHAPRDLVRATQQLLPDFPAPDKSVRDAMKGLTYEQARTAGLGDALDAYVARDAIACYEIFARYEAKWPDVEKDYSELLRLSCWKGMPMNRESVVAARIKLQDAVAGMIRNIPWAEDGTKPLSHHEFRRHARSLGITDIPASLDKKDPAAIAFFKKYEPEHPWITAYRNLRSYNGHFKKLLTLEQGLRADDTFPLAIKYMGAHTGRTSAGDEDSDGGKFNPLNMNRKPLGGVDIRNQFAAPEGFTFIIADYSAIEAIMLLWRVGDTTILPQVAKGVSPYQAYAKSVGWYTGDADLKEANKDLYTRAKVSVLQLGYQSGWAKFKVVAETNYNAFFTDEEAQQLVATFREKNPRIVNHWNEHALFAAYSANHGDATHEVELRSGRDLVYYNPTWQTSKWSDGRPRRELSATTSAFKPTRLYGGILTENEIQATARDVLRDGRVAVERAGHPVVLDVYDELVCLVPENEAEHRAREIEHLMVSSSPWAEGCPLSVKATISPIYTKD